MPFMATFILVHGTFARAAHWPALQDGITVAASDAGEQSQFTEVTWSGRNRASARQAAASEISAVVQHIQSTSRDEKIFIIGHSHGGSAIAYFLKEHADLAKTLRGCAFLSTPFIAIRPRPHADRIVSAVSYFPSVALIIFWNYITRYLQPNLSPLENAQSSMYFWGWILIMALIAIAVFTQRTFRNADELLNEVHLRQTADLPSANYLFLRFSGDEAAAALSATQFIAWLSVKLSQTLEFLTRPLFRSRTIVRILVGGLSGGAVSLAALSSLGIADETVYSFRAAAQGDIVVSLAFYFYYFCVIILPYLLAFAVLAAFSIFLAQALTSWAFGWMEFSTGFFVELAIEPLPFGAHTMAHIDWSAGAVGLEGITHSWTYAHPKAIQYVQEWVKTTLRCPPDIEHRS
jgi:pimeloyl-ACP methyl ester carboxylesterase